MMESRKQHSPRWIILSVILIVVAASCSSTEPEPTQTSASTAIPSPTAVAPTNTPATAPDDTPEATATPVASPTSTPEPTEVPTDVPTPTPEPVVAPTAEAGDTEETESTAHSEDQDAHEHVQDENVYYEDDFTDPESGWVPTQAFDNYFIGYHEPEWYHVQVDVPGDRAMTMLPDQTFDDFTLELEVFPEASLSAPEGDFRYGLVVRRAGKSFYAFVLSSRTQTWYVLKSSLSGIEVLDEGGDESIQGEGGSDTLRVDAEGSTLYFHINGQVVSQIEDGDYAEGEIGFYLENLDSPRTHIHNEYLVIRGVETPPFTALDCTVTSLGLNLRAGPSTAYTPPITAFSNGARLEATGRNEDGSWVQVEAPETGQSGWVRAAPAYLACSGSPSDLPESTQIFSGSN